MNVTSDNYNTGAESTHYIKEDESGGCLQNLTDTVAASGSHGTSIYLALGAWATYFCIYGFRKAWCVATWESEDYVFGMEPKSWYTILQAIGYAIGKMIGTFVVSSLPCNYHFRTLLALPAVPIVLWTVLGLLFPLLIPTSIAMFFSPMPLAWCWSLLYRYVEGRDGSDIVGLFISSSFIVGSGAAKSTGKIVLDYGVEEAWMPALVSALYALPLLAACTLVSAAPVPTTAERLRNVPRERMTASQQKNFITSYFPGIVALTLAYAINVAVRDYRDFFQAEIFADLNGGEKVDAAVFTQTEVPVAVAVLLALSGLSLIKNSKKSVLLLICIFVGANALMLSSQLLFKAGYVSGKLWFISLGIGTYLMFVPIGSIFYDRMIGALGTRGTASFMISLSDCFGNFGTVALLIFKALDKESSSRGHEEFFSKFVLVGSSISATCGVLTFIYWRNKLKSCSLTTG